MDVNYKIVDNSQEESSQWNNDGTAPNSKGGTERIRDTLLERLDNKYLQEYKIIHSRVRDDFFEEGKKHILLCHDTWNDPEAQHLRDVELRKRFAKIAFVSHYQFQTYHMGLGVPHCESIVMLNAIDPIEVNDKQFDGQIKLIYHTTPHRGLHLLVPVFDELYNLFGDDIHLDVYSSFDIYGWGQRDEQFKPIFDVCREHPGITYHGYQPNEVVREALKKAHIFAYPNIWPETSCMAAMEAMSAKCLVVCPDHCALPETTAGFSIMYRFSEDPTAHANDFANVMFHTITKFKEDQMVSRLEFQKAYADTFYNWNGRINDWHGLFSYLNGKEKENG